MISSFVHPPSLPAESMNFPLKTLPDLAFKGFRLALAQC
jgi:hypothetical protein